MKKNITAPIQGSSLPVSSSIGPFESDGSFHMIAQAKPVHDYMAASRKDIRVDPITNIGTVEKNGTTIILQDVTLKNCTPKAKKLLLMGLDIFADQMPRRNEITAEAINKSRRIRITVTDYMGKCHLSDRKNAGDALRESVKSLFATSAEWTSTKDYYKQDGKRRRSKGVYHHKARFVDYIAIDESGDPINGGAVEFDFSYTLAESLASLGYVMPVNPAVYLINPHDHPYSIQLAWKIFALHNNNINNRNTERLNWITVDTLLSAVDDLPRYEDIWKTGGIYNRIIEPFNQDMKELVNVGILDSFAYYTTDGKEVASYSSNGEEKKGLGDISYEFFSSLIIKYVLSAYPDQTQRIEAKQKQIAAAIKRRAAIADKKKNA